MWPFVQMDTILLQQCVLFRVYLHALQLLQPWCDIALHFFVILNKKSEFLLGLMLLLSS